MPLYLKIGLPACVFYLGALVALEALRVGLVQPRADHK